MDIDVIIEMVTREVVKKLREKGEDFIQTRKRVLLLCKALDRTFDAMKQELNSINYEIDYMEKGTDISSYEEIVVPELNNSELVNISMGNECGTKEHVVIESLLSGKKVFLIAEGIAYRKYSKTSNRVLYGLYESYEKKLCEYGVQITDKKDFIQKFNETEKHAQVEEGSEENAVTYKSESGLETRKGIVEFVNKKVLTESDIRKVYQEGYREINVSKSSIITSLAVDYIEINGIKVNRLS